MKRREFLAALLATSCGGVVNPPEVSMRPIFPQRLTPQLPTLIRGPEPRPPIYNNPSPTTPLHLSASVLLNSGSTGSVNPAVLKNPMGQDMEILEIKFELSSQSAKARGLGGTVLVSLALDALKLTNASVPLWSFGRAENLSGELKTSSNTAPTHGFLSYSWRLPRPLFVPAGSAVIPDFNHRGDIPNSINLRVGYSARTVKTKPRVVYIPWVARYISEAFNLADAGAFSSNELDLVNPHDEVLHLQRFTGRTLWQTTTAVAENQALLTSRYLRMRMVDSYGRPLARTFMPFGAIFAAGSRSWEMDNGTVLDPKSFYIVDLQKDAMTSVAGYGQAQVAMVGWREVPYK